MSINLVHFVIILGNWALLDEREWIPGVLICHLCIHPQLLRDGRVHLISEILEARDHGIHLIVVEFVKRLTRNLDEKDWIFQRADDARAFKIDDLVIRVCLG